MGPACSETTVSEALVYVQDEGPQPPEYLLFSWLYCRDYLQRDQRVPEAGPLGRSDNPLATILIEVDTDEPTRRGVFIRGMIGGAAVSSGRGVVDISPGVRSQLTVRLTGGAVPDDERAAALVDWCREPPGIVDAGPADAPPDSAPDAGVPDRAPDAADTGVAPEAPPMPIELERGLVGHWPFDEASGTSTPDRSGGNNNASLLMGPTFVAGRVGAGALDVSGELDLAEVRDPADGRLDFDSGDFTVSVWVKTTQMPGPMDSAPDMVAKWPSNLNMTSPRSGWALTLPQGGVLFKGFTDNGPQMGVPGRAINDGMWHHLAGRKTATELTLFIDGRQEATRPHTLGGLSSSAPLWMGGFGNNRGLNFNGQLDDVRIYNRALTPAEIRALASVPAP